MEGEVTSTKDLYNDLLNEWISTSADDQNREVISCRDPLDYINNEQFTIRNTTASDMTTTSSHSDNQFHENRNLGMSKALLNRDESLTEQNDNEREKAEMHRDVSLTNYFLNSDISTTRHRHTSSELTSSGLFDSSNNWSLEDVWTSNAMSGSMTSDKTSKEACVTSSITSFEMSDWEIQTTSNNRTTSMLDLGEHELSASLIKDDDTTTTVGTAAAKSLSTSPSTKFQQIDSIESKLHDEARITNWSSVLHLCKTSPHLARYSGPDRWTALHHACNRRPPAAVVEALLKAYPDALLEQDQKGWTPLHHACRFKAKPEVVRLLLSLYPTLGRLAATRRGNRGRTALYYAIRYDAPEGVVEMLLNVDPTAVLEKDRAGESPLSLIWDSFALSCTGRKALQACIRQGENGQPFASLTPGSKVQQRWEKVNLLLQSVFHTKGDWRILHAICSIPCHPTLFALSRALYPEQQRQIDENGKTALHCAAASHANGETARAVISALVQNFPEASAISDKVLGQLPLHVAAENEKKRHWTLDGVKAIYLIYPDAVRTPDALGRLPLHLAICNIAHSVPRQVSISTQQSGTTEQYSTVHSSVILNLIDCFPSAASHADNEGKLPLHMIAEHAEEWGQETEAVYLAYKEAISLPIHSKKRKDSSTSKIYPNEGCLPLHLAAISPDAKPTLLQQLLSAYPKAISVRDAQGRLPFHLACEAGKGWNTGLQILYEAYPQAISMPCAQLHFLPLHYACYSTNASPDVISTLISLNSTSTRVPCVRRRLPLHLACLSGKSWKNGLKQILQNFPDAIDVADDDNLLPFHHAALYNAESSCGDENDDSVQDLVKIDTLFHLLLFSPSLLKMCCKD